MKDTAFTCAIRYAQRGWRVAPAPAGKKFPVMKHWQTKATTDIVTVARWFQQWPDSNVCIVTGSDSGVFVLDVDDSPGKTGSATLAALEAEHGPLPLTYTVGTGSGGVHHYFSWEGVDFDLRNSCGRLGKDLDTRGNGGQVVAPPSRADDVNHFQAYTVLHDVPPVPAPAWLVDLLRKPTYVAPEPAEPFRRPTPGGFSQPDSGTVGVGYTGSAIAAELERIRTAPNGQGNHTLASATFNIATLAAAPWSDVTPEAAYTAIQQELGMWHWNSEADRVRDMNTVNRQFEYGVNNPRTSTPKPVISRDPFRSALNSKGL